MSPETPAAMRSSSLNCAWVVLAGWMTSDFASATFASSENKFQLVDPLDAGLLAALDAESEDRAGAFREVFVRKRLVFAIRQFRIIHPGNFRVVRQISDNLAGIFDMAFNAQ